MAVQGYDFQYVLAIHSLGPVARQFDYVRRWICTFSRASINRYVHAARTLIQHIRTF